MEVDIKEGNSVHVGLRVAQLPYEQDQTWIALSDAEVAEVKRGRKNTTQSSPSSSGTDDEEEDSRRGKLSLVVVGPNSWKAQDQRVGGLLIDEIIEHLPEKTVTTGLSFQYDQPNSQPPHALLLAVPSELNLQQSKPWTIDELTDIVKDTMDLAKVRAVDLDALEGVGDLFPFLFISQTSPTKERQSINFAEVPDLPKFGDTSFFSQRVRFSGGLRTKFEKAERSILFYSESEVLIDFPWPVTIHEVRIFLHQHCTVLLLGHNFKLAIPALIVPQQKSTIRLSSIQGFSLTSSVERMVISSSDRRPFEGTIYEVSFSYDL